MLSIAGSWAESSSRNNVNIFPWGADHLEVYQFDDHNPPGGKDHWPYGPLWVWHVSPHKSLPMPVKTNEDRKTGSYGNEGRLCARARPRTDRKSVIRSPMLPQSTPT